MADNSLISSLPIRLAKSSLAILIILGVGYFYWGEFSRHQVALDDFQFRMSAAPLAVALVFCLLSYFCDAIIWRMLIATRVDARQIKFLELIAVIYAGGMFRYVPGRIWTVTAQALWLGKYGIEKSFTVYINMVCMIELVIFSLYAGLVYLAVYVEAVSAALLVGLLVALIGVNLLFNFCSSSVINYLFLRAKKATAIEMEPINSSPKLLATIQLIFTFSWVLYGAAAFYLASGLGLVIVPVDMIPVVASMALSWLAGFLVVVAPAGLGVREGVMLWLLKPVVAVQTALLLPIATRLLLVLAEGVLGVVAFCLGTRRRVFALTK